MHILPTLPLNIVTHEILRWVDAKTLAAAAAVSSVLYIAATNELIDRIGRANYTVIVAGAPASRKKSVVHLIDFYHNIRAPEYLLPVAKQLIWHHTQKHSCDIVDNGWNTISSFWLFAGLTDCVRLIPDHYGLKFSISNSPGCFREEILSVVSKSTSRPDGDKLMADTSIQLRYILSADLWERRPAGIIDQSTLFVRAMQVRNLYMWSDYDFYDSLHRIIEVADVHTMNLIVQRFAYIFDTANNASESARVIAANSANPRININLETEHEKYCNAEMGPDRGYFDKNNCVPYYRRIAADFADKDWRDTTAEEAESIIRKITNNQSIDCPIMEPIRLWHNSACEFCNIEQHLVIRN